MLVDIPSQRHIYVDANIFYYHFVNTPPVSEPCSDFLERVENGDFTVSTSSIALSEAIHKVMLAEAATKFDLAKAGLVGRLKRKGEMLKQLTLHQQVPSTVKSLGIDVCGVSLATLDRATCLSTEHGLMTNDSIAVATMQEQSVTDLVTNDDDFDRIEWITVWKPR